MTSLSPASPPPRLKGGYSPRGAEPENVGGGLGTRPSPCWLRNGTWRLGGDSRPRVLRPGAQYSVCRGQEARGQGKGSGLFPGGEDQQCQKNKGRPDTQKPRMDGSQGHMREQSHSRITNWMYIPLSTKKSMESSSVVSRGGSGGWGVTPKGVAQGSFLE